MSMPGEYPNRSDLRNPATRQARFTGQTYGQGAAQIRSQQAVPAGTSPGTVQAQQMAANTRPRPGQNLLSRPSERPDEPITAGAPFGPGPGPMQAGIRPRFIKTTRLEDQLMALYQRYPREGIAMLIEKARRQQNGNQ